ncbi:NAD(P)/FAD-dependent oxidoreductase [Homoserinimonas sp. OAct 916]|uniref:protoporphyrinogen/coproporphyrinogen oxidase n=1 Tax=Homoserinimonas sp. OAct 916 TaxID=2211450 RepID=UPI000DBE5E6F|nr:FAD-dependent oxidoreductase [Homoserinimonas sp. OAct 916]
MNRPDDVIVVGGGIAGLVAARELAIGGLAVTVCEASESLGGRVARHTVAGIDLDAGAESFATRGDTVADFLTELGLGQAIVSPNQVGAWLKPAQGPAVPMPATGLLGIPATPLARGVIAATGLLGALRAQADVILPRRVGATSTTLAELVRVRMGQRVLDRLVAPVVTGIHSRNPDTLDADVVAPGLRTALADAGSLSGAVRSLRQSTPGSAVGGLRGGMYLLVEALHADLLARGVRIRTHARATGVTARQVTLATGEQLAARAVVLATPLGSESTDVSIVIATLVVDSAGLDDAPRGTGLLVAAGTPGIRAKALTHASAKWPWLAATLPAHRHVLRLSYNNTGNNLPEAALADIARVDAENLLGVPLAAQDVHGFARVVWPIRHDPVARRDGVWQVGEGVASTGLAAVISQARTESESVRRALTPRQEKIEP